MTTGRARGIPPPKADLGATDSDDHRMARTPGGGGQPTEDLDRGTGTEHLESASQDARPGEPTQAATDDEALGGGPGGDEDGVSGPMFEELA